MSYIDLHTHSSCSDGSLSPEELVKYAKGKNLSAIALTDHDTLSGVERAVIQGKKSNIEVVPGIEFSVKSEKETHILGYYIDYKNDILLNRLAELRNSRNNKTKEICRRLRKLGFEIYEEDIIKKASPGESVGRVHIANEMISKGYVSSVSEAFEKYIGNGKPAYYSDEKPKDIEIISLISKAGGVSYLAHPLSTGKTGKELEDYIIYLKENGLCGIECYYTTYKKEQRENLVSLTKKLGLAISGGSDFHGANKPDIDIGVGYGDLQIEYSLLEEMKKHK